MAFIHFLNKLKSGLAQARAGRKRPTRTPKTPVSKHKHERATTALQATQPTSVQRQNATIIITYTDETGTRLCPPQIIVGTIGQPLHVKFNEFTDYDLVKITGFTSLFVDRYGAIKLTYRKRDAAVIWVIARDIDDHHALAAPKFVRGQLGKPYSLVAPSIDGYRLMQAVGPTNGILGQKQQQVTYYFRKAEWQNVSYRVSYLLMHDFCTTAADPAGRKLPITLAKGSVWQTFISIQLQDNSWWHCLGGDIWVQETSQVERFTKRPDAPLGELKNDPSAEVPTIPIHHPARIDYVPGEELTLYDRPFGKACDHIADGTNVTLTGRLRQSHMVWFCVDNRGWTIRQYLNLDPNPDYFMRQVTSEK